MLRTTAIFIFIVMLLMATVTTAETIIVQIGGGVHVDNSQGQIEDNVIWLNKILRKTGMPLYNYFASGARDEKDVALFVENSSNSPMMVLSRVFDEPNYEMVKYRHNLVPEISGSMYKEEIMESLKGIISRLNQQRDLLLIYNGHGLPDESDIKNNYLSIWGREKITVGEMDNLFDMAEDGTTYRYVFPQCYSGGFYYLVKDTPHSSRLSEQNRCGFMAESPYDQSEGCSLSTNKEEYRDYSTYFFAPLNGSTRLGEELPLDPDMNADGAVSFSESHIYAIKAGRSKDLSRSTSEMYLEEWSPWYLRWAKPKLDVQNRYRDIARFVADRDGYELNEVYLNRSRRALRKKVADLNQETEECKKGAGEIAERLKDDALKYWPELLHPYTSEYKAMIEVQAHAVADHIKSNDDYHILVKTQDRCAELEGAILESERELAQVEKIIRYMDLATIEYYFNRFASKVAKAEYQSLLKCEDGIFFYLSES